ncbi:MAG: MFS transporter [Fulvimarina manganoxydans]|uniref:MFS transporter n=1 Tax=Fulvimarina manganoxydans TaxID=937218 RepID=UPI0023567EDB|nr:MFS transporter [Fulvimarina manganoxydans]MCK5934117.1 MFS transporter [Fulvimarina manganoxydans]
MMARRQIATVGFIATAVTFGPGRMAYGMFLPQLRDEFGFGTGTAGSIAGFAFAAFFGALFLTGWINARIGPRLPVLFGGICAVFGFALTALAPGLATMTLGVALASASAGFAWTPFNSMAEKAVDVRFEKRTLSVVSTGTTFGIIGAGLLALGLVMAGQTWRIAWWSFSAIALSVVIIPLLLLPKEAIEGQQTDISMGAAGQRLRSLDALPLYGFALSFGATNGTYLSYWIDHISSSGGLPGLSSELIGPVLLIVFGLAGCLGLLTGDVEDKIGLRALLVAMFTGSAVSLVLLALLPGSWTATLLSAALQGVCLMALSSVYSFWSERLFPGISSISFTATLLVYATGNMLAPPVAGFMSDAMGLGPTFAVFAGLSLLSVTMVRWVKEV